MSPFEQAQEPNLRAANEHLHKQIEALRDRIAVLEADKRWLEIENKRLQQTVDNYWEIIMEGSK